VAADVRRAGVAFVEGIPTRYHVPQDVHGQCSRERLGEGCDRIKARVDTAGFAKAITLSMRQGRMDSEDVRILWERFYLRLAQTTRRGGRHDLANDFVDRAELAGKQETASTREEARCDSRRPAAKVRGGTPA
jgi:hypothetical protein